MSGGKIAVLLNPSSGGGRALDRKSLVEARLRANGVSFDLFVTDSEQALKDLTAESGRNYGTVVGAGGDSTFHIVVNELMRSGSSARFGMIGLGSSNDVDREFALDSVEKACLALKTGWTRRIDLGAIRSEGRILRRFIGQANVGIGASVNIFVERLVRTRPAIGRRQTLAGILGIVRAYRHGEVPLPLRVSSDGGAVSGDFVAVVFANIRYWATGRMIAPEARPDDGLLDACAVEACSIARLARIARLSGTGRHGRMKQVRFMRSRSYELESAEQFAVQTDGEILGGTDTPEKFTRIGIEIIPGALEIVAGEPRKDKV
jgi:diacylglycerol kinase (ATP)